jgi:hypothetical protein
LLTGGLRINMVVLLILRDLVAKGWYAGMEKGDISFTPKVISEIIRELPWEKSK